MSYLIEIIKQSWFFHQLKKDEKEITLLPGSNIISFLINLRNRYISRISGYVESSEILNFLKSLVKFVFNNPLGAISILILSSTIINTILWLMFDNYQMNELIIRLLFLGIVLSLMLIHDIKKIIFQSRIVKFFNIFKPFLYIIKNHKL